MNPVAYDVRDRLPGCAWNARHGASSIGIANVSPFTHTARASVPASKWQRSRDDWSQKKTPYSAGTADRIGERVHEQLVDRIPSAESTRSI